MKTFDLNTRFSTGKHEGKTLEEVFQQDPQYVEKCLISDEDFAISDKSIQKLFEKYPEIDLSDEAIDTNLDKLDAMDMEDGDLIFTDDVYEDDFAGGSAKIKGGDDELDLDDDLFGDDDDEFGDEADDWEDDDDDL